MLWSSTIARRAVPDVVDQLTAIVSRYDQQVILAPYPGMAVKIALTAWGRIETLDTIDETKSRKVYRGLSRDLPPHRLVQSHCIGLYGDRSTGSAGSHE